MGERSPSLPGRPDTRAIVRARLGGLVRLLPLLSLGLPFRSPLLPFFGGPAIRLPGGAEDRPKTKTEVQYVSIWGDKAFPFAGDIMGVRDAMPRQTYR